MLWIRENPIGGSDRREYGSGAVAGLRFHSPLGQGVGVVGLGCLQVGPLDRAGFGAGLDAEHLVVVELLEILVLRPDFLLQGFGLRRRGSVGLGLAPTGRGRSGGDVRRRHEDLDLGNLRAHRLVGGGLRLARVFDGARGIEDPDGGHRSRGRRPLQRLPEGNLGVEGVEEGPQRGIGDESRFDASGPIAALWDSVHLVGQVGENSIGAPVGLDAFL